MIEEIKTKYRVEEHHNNSTTYLLYGIYNSLKSAKNKKEKLIKNGINASNLFILEVTTITKTRVFN